jgi:hypothetical protein
MTREARIDKLREWLDVGIANNFCTNLVCMMHDGVPMSDTEVEAEEEGLDPCVFVVRINNEMATVAPFALQDQEGLNND